MAPAMDRKSTTNAKTLPTVLVVGAGAELIERCRRSAETAKSFLELADMANAATMAARCRPMVIVLTEDLYAFDPEEFDALARDVRGKVIRVADELVPQLELDARILGAIAEVKRTRG